MSQNPPDYGQEQLRSALARLAAEPGAVTPVKVWRALTAEERERAALSLLENAPRELRHNLVRETARLHHFRPQTLASWPELRIARAVARRAPTSRSIITGLLRHLHLPDRKDMLADYLDGLGVEHDDGVITKDIGTIEVAPTEVKRAADRLLPMYPLDEVVTYFLSLLAL